MSKASERIVGLARKLYLMSKSKSVHEAAVAKSKLQQLMSRHNLSEKDVLPIYEELAFVLESPISAYKENLIIQTMAILGGQVYVYPKEDGLHFHYEDSSVVIEKAIDTVEYYIGLINNDSNIPVDVLFRTDVLPSFKLGMSIQYMKHLEEMEKDKKQKNRTTSMISGFLEHWEIPKENNMPMVLEDTKKESETPDIDVRVPEDRTEAPESAKMSDEEQAAMDRARAIEREPIYSQIVERGKIYVHENYIIAGKITQGETNVQSIR